MKKHLGKRERVARKRKESFRSVTMSSCNSKGCSAWVTLKLGRKKSRKFGLFGDVFCGQCRKKMQSCAREPTVGIANN